MKAPLYKLIFLFLFSVNFANAQITSYWAKSANGPGSDEGMSVCLDPSSNVFICGHFNSTTLPFGTYTLTNYGFYNVYLAKYNNNGTILWAKGIPGGLQDFGYSINCDANGNSFITGSYSSPSLTFGTYTVNKSGTFSVFIAKYDANGNALWAKSPTGSSTDEGMSVATDVSGNVFVTGSFTSPSLTLGTYTLTNAGGKNIFLAKYDANGNVLWAKSGNGSGSDKGTSASTDAAGNVFVTGYFDSPTLVFGTYTLTNTGNDDVFVVKYNSSGTVLWAKSITGSGNDFAYSGSCDPTGKYFVTGSFSSPTLTVGSYTLANTGGSNAFIARYDANGIELWAKSAKGNNDNSFSVTSYSAGVFITGSIGSTSMTIGSKTITAPNGSTDPVFIAQYDLNGNLICAAALSSGGDDSNGATTDALGNLYFTGDFTNNPFVIGTDTLSLTGNENIFVSKLKLTCAPDLVDELNKNSFVKIYPNPNVGIFDLQIETGTQSIRISNCFGQTIYERGIFEPLDSKIDISSQPPGIYFVEIKTEKGILTEKIVIQK